MYFRCKSNYQEKRVWNPLTGLTPQPCGACPKPGLQFLTSNVMVFFNVQCIEMRGGHSTDIGGSFYYHCFKLSTIIMHVIHGVDILDNTLRKIIKIQ